MTWPLIAFALHAAWRWLVDTRGASPRASLQTLVVVRDGEAGEER